MFCYSRNGLQLALLPRYSFDSRHKFLELINCHNRDKMAFETSEETIQEEEEDVGVRQSQNFAQQHFPQMASKARRKMITSVIRFGQIAPHYGKIFEVFGNFLKLFQYWAKFKTLHFYAIGPIVIAENGQIFQPLGRSVHTSSQALVKGTTSYHSGNLWFASQCGKRFLSLKRGMKQGKNQC